MKHKLFRKADLIVILLAAAPVLIYFLWSYQKADNLVAEISVDGKVIERIDLLRETERREFVLDTEPKVVIVSENGSVYFEESGCMDQICVSAGKLNKKGDTAICLPAKTVLTVVGSEVDAVTY